MKYRVCIEGFDEKTGELMSRHEEWHIPAIDSAMDDGEGIGIALAGAIHGICAYDEPSAFKICTWLLWRIVGLPKPFDALAEAARLWWRHGGNEELDSVCRVVVDKKWWDAGGGGAGVYCEAMPASTS